MIPGLFKSRRTPAPQPETAKVVEAVWAYYEAGRRPATTPIAAFVEPELPSHQTANGPDEPAVTEGGQSLSELADELEALIESIRYGNGVSVGDAA